VTVPFQRDTGNAAFLERVSRSERRDRTRYVSTGYRQAAKTCLIRGTAYETRAQWQIL
jgi:hypothetical protein